jgi:predicted lipoprotein with Yx(FWY)xxD motif
MTLHLAIRARQAALLVALSAALLDGIAHAAGATAMVTDGVLTGHNGMTLYTFDKDTAGSGKSVCNGPYVTNWPPLMAAESEKAAGDYSIIIRDDGTKQWAMKGKPLYY